MATADRKATFLLERFGWSSPGRLELGGHWSGPPPSAALPPLLAISLAARVHLIQASAWARSDAGGELSRSLGWSAESGQITGVPLCIGDCLEFELPRGNQDWRRSRSRLVAARADRPEAMLQEGQTGGQSASADVQGALVRAREQAQAGIAAAQRASAEAALARQEADRERQRRHAETARIRSALQTARMLADEQLAAERRAAEDARAERDARQKEIAGERRLRAALQDQLRALGLRLDQVSSQAREQIGAMEASLEVAQNEADVAAEELRRCYAEFTSLLVELHRHQEQVDALLAERQQAREHVDRLTAELAASNAQSAALTSAALGGIRSVITGTRKRAVTVQHRLRAIRRGVRRRTRSGAADDPEERARLG